MCRVASTKEKAPISENIYPPVCPHLHSTEAHLAHVYVCMFVCSFITTNKQTMGPGTLWKFLRPFNSLYQPQCTMCMVEINPYLSSSSVLREKMLHLSLHRDPIRWGRLEQYSGYKRNLYRKLISSVLCKIQMQLWIDLQSAVSKFVANKRNEIASSVSATPLQQISRLAGMGGWGHCTSYGR